MLITEEDEPKALFVTHSKLYKYIRMLIDPTNASADFQQTIKVVMTQYTRKTLPFYLYSSIIYSNTIEKHLNLVKHILKSLKHASILLNINKCDFFTKEVEHFRHVVRHGKLRIDDVKTAF